MSPKKMARPPKAAKAPAADPRNSVFIVVLLFYKRKPDGKEKITAPLIFSVPQPLVAR